VDRQDAQLVAVVRNHAHRTDANLSIHARARRFAIVVERWQVRSLLDQSKNGPGLPPQIRNASHLCSEVLGTLEHSQREAWGGALAPTYLIVDRNLVERHRLHKCDSLSVPSEPTRHD